MALMASWASRRTSLRLLLPPGGEGGSGTGPGAVTERLVIPPPDPIVDCNRGESTYVFIRIDRNKF